MQEDTLLVCRKTGKTGEDSNPVKFNEHILLPPGLDINTTKQRRSFFNRFLLQRRGFKKRQRQNFDQKRRPYSLKGALGPTTNHSEFLSKHKKINHPKSPAFSENLKKKMTQCRKKVTFHLKSLPHLFNLLLALQLLNLSKKWQLIVTNAYFLTITIASFDHRN